MELTKLLIRFNNKELFDEEEAFQNYRKHHSDRQNNLNNDKRSRYSATLQRTSGGLCGGNVSSPRPGESFDEDGSSRENDESQAADSEDQSKELMVESTPLQSSKIETKLNNTDIKRGKFIDDSATNLKAALQKGFGAVVENDDGEFKVPSTSSGLIKDKLKLSNSHNDSKISKSTNQKVRSNARNDNLSNTTKLNLDKDDKIKSQIKIGKDNGENIKREPVARPDSSKSKKADVIKSKKEYTENEGKSATAVKKCEKPALISRVSNQSFVLYK